MAKVKLGYADTPPAADPVSMIAQATAAVTNSITNFLGIRQQRLAQESADDVQKEAFNTQIKLSQEDYFKQISAQNADFGKNIIGLERNKRNIWRTSTGVLIMVAVPILVALVVYLIVKKGGDNG